MGLDTCLAIRCLTPYGGVGHIEGVEGATPDTNRINGLAGRLKQSEPRLPWGA